LQPIVIHGLSRSYLIDEVWSQSPLAFLRTQPNMPGTAHRFELIEIEAVDGHFRSGLPGGPRLLGPLRWLAAQLDSAISREANELQSRELTLPGALLRNPRGRRVAFMGGPATGKTWLSMALLSAGWLFEGDARIQLRTDGVRALPRTIRIRDPLRALPSAWRKVAATAPCLAPSLADPNNYEVRALDPRLFGRDWRLMSGPVDAILFLELNPGGRGAIRPLDSTRAFRYALDMSRGRMSSLSAAALYKFVAGAAIFRLRIGQAEEAVELIDRALREASRYELAGRFGVGAAL
jgi:hypothetical protein